MRIEVAPSSFSDWAALHALLLSAYAYMEGRIDPPSSLLRMDARQLQEKARDEVLILALEDRRLVGCCFVQVRDDCVYVGKLAVDAGARRRGRTFEALGFANVGEYAHPGFDRPTSIRMRKRV